MKPRKRFGQHFLQDQAIIARIVTALAPQKNEHLIEIGPGQGALTVPVLKQTQQLEVIEFDRDLIPELEYRAAFVKRAGLIIHQADALDFDFASLKTDARLLRIFGNLPYNISTPLLFHLLDFAPIISDMLFMLQKEVAQRLAAAPGSKEYGRLSVMLQYHCAAKLLFGVPANAFYPPPQVQSSIVQLTPYRTLPYRAENYAHFAEIVKQAFGQRRKTLRNSLRALVNDASWSAVSISSALRAENLSVKDFVELSNITMLKGE
jgi:16S rRNA (adenine1518-N6/adenine1519-N6)-dimethyltransferase